MKLPVPPPPFRRSGGFDKQTATNPAELITAAVVLDDHEWFEHRCQIEGLPKGRVQGGVIAALGSILQSDLKSPDDIEQAISRMGELVAALMRVPPEYPTIDSFVLRPLPPPSAEQQRLMDRVTNQIGPDLMAARRRKDQSAVTALANELREIGPAMLPDDPAGEDLAVVRAVFGAYLDVFRSWFNRAEWLGQRVAKSSAYSLIDSVAGAGSKSAIRSTILPMMRQLAEALTDEEVRSGVLLSIEEFEEILGDAA